MAACIFSHIYTFTLIILFVLRSIDLQLCQCSEFEKIDCESVVKQDYFYLHCTNYMHYSNASHYWRHQTIIAIDVFNEQNMIESASSINNYQSNIVVVICQISTIQAATEFMNNVSIFIPDLQYMTFLLDDKQITEVNITQIIEVFENNRNNISTIVMFVENITSVVNILRSVSSNFDLKLSGILHTTEWMIVSTDELEVLQHLQNEEINVDFITLLFMCSFKVTCIAQKSRNNTMKITSQISVSVEQFISCSFSVETVCSIHQFCTKGKIRKKAMIYLSSQKSVLSLMQLDVAVLERNMPRIATITMIGNVIEMDGYSIALLKLLSLSLDFTFSVVSANDGQDYGVVESNKVTGLIGLLARKKAALTTLPISRTSSRLQVIDFIPVVTFKDTIHIIYRETFEALKPQVDKMIEADVNKSVKGIGITLKGSRENGCVDSKGNVYDFVSRFFSPWNGVPEDPVTGSWHVVAGPYWAKELNKLNFYARQCSKRGGDLWVTVEKDRVVFTGDSVVNLRGTFSL